MFHSEEFLREDLGLGAAPGIGQSPWEPLEKLSEQMSPESLLPSPEQSSKKSKSEELTGFLCLNFVLLTMASDQMDMISFTLRIVLVFIKTTDYLLPKALLHVNKAYN